MRRSHPIGARIRPRPPRSSCLGGPARRDNRSEHMTTVERSGPVLHLERMLARPPEPVFGAFVAPADLVQWWGPHGFTVPKAELDVRVGGLYRLTMQPPQGAVFH